MESPAETLTITVERVTYQNPQNGYMVLKATSRGIAGGVTVIGSFGPVQPGEELRVWGVWTTHQQYGPQFKALRYTSLKPSTLKGLEKYLGSGMIKGVGPVTAKRLVATFGMDTLTVIESQPERIVECAGVGPVRAERIARGWSEQRAVHDVMVFLQGHGVSTAYAVRIYRKYGAESVAKVQANPYLLAEEIRGIGFKTADKIAGEFGITGDDPRRVRAGLQHLLLAALDEGHLFLYADELRARALDILTLADPLLIETAVAAMADERRLSVRDPEGRPRVYLPFACRHEEGSVELLHRLRAANTAVPPRERVAAALAAAVTTCGITLTDLQQLAVERSLRERFLVITGGPGTGKTTTLRAVVSAQMAWKRELLLASPTGRAAKRLSEVTGRPASTLHRLLEYSPADRAFKRNREHPLTGDVVIVDEASMLDQELFHALLAAVPPLGTLILVGDVDQLPSVGPGMVLRSIIESEALPVVRLDTVFRQAEQSLIITNAHRVNRGNMPVLVKPDGQTTSDCYFLAAETPEEAMPLLLNIVSRSLPKRFGYHPVEDIQVLTPMNRGSLGTVRLNQDLQQALNPAAPDKPEFASMHRCFRVGDKIIQLRNNYDKEVFNGDLGVISRIDSEDQEVEIQFPQGPRVLDASDMLDVGHAYAVTVHKAQGSEFPCVVVPVTTQHYVMLQRNLLYTAMTRARRTLVLVGSKKALWLAIRNAKVTARNTMLTQLLRDALAPVRTRGG